MLGHEYFALQVKLLPHLDKEHRCLLMGFMAENNVLLQLLIINANAIAPLALVPEIEEGAVCHRQIIDSSLIF